MGSYFREQLEETLKTIDVEGRVIDVGGSQKLLEGRTKTWNPTEYKVLDVEDRGGHVDYLYDIQSEYGMVARRNLVFIRNDYSDPFDMVFCLEVMEYLYDPYQAVRNLNKLCKKGGTLVISFPFVYPLHPPTGKDYLRYTKYGALKLLERCGFEIVRYVPRKFKFFGPWRDLIGSEGFRFDKSEDPNTLDESGCVIIARKK